MERIALSEESRVRVVLVAMIAVIAVAGYVLFDEGAPGAKADVESFGVDIGTVNVIGEGVRVSIRIRVDARGNNDQFNRIGWWVERESDDTVHHCDMTSVTGSPSTLTHADWFAPGTYRIVLGYRTANFHLVGSERMSR